MYPFIFAKEERIGGIGGEIIFEGLASTVVYGMGPRVAERTFEPSKGRFTIKNSFRDMMETLRCQGKCKQRLEVRVWL
jgi:hypothetical protein